MSKLLIAIPTCRVTSYGGLKSGSLNGQGARADLVRQTWLPEAQRYADVRFFYGNPLPCPVPWAKVMGDEVELLGCPDDYAGLPTKVRRMIQWAYNESYDHMLKVDDDTFLCAERLARSDYRQFDYVGSAHEATMVSGQLVKYASGAGYCLSRKAMKVLIDAPAPTDWAEDRENGLELSKAGIGVHNDTAYHMCACEVCRVNFRDDFILVHTAPWVEYMTQLMEGGYDKENCK